MRRQLTNRGYKIVSATNGEEGLKAAKIENPDLILLDIRMPVMDGMTMLNLLHKNGSAKNTKVIILTNLEPDAKIIDGAFGGRPAYYFIKSDTQLNDLLVKIEELI